jgi:hypothetical protein
MKGRAGREPPKDDHKRREKARLAAALRENLKRRKAQTKERAVGDRAGPREKPHDSAEIDADKRKG